MSTQWHEFKDKLDEFYPKHDAMPRLPLESGAYYLPAPKVASSTNVEPQHFEQSPPGAPDSSSRP